MLMNRFAEDSESKNRILDVKADSKLTQTNSNKLKQLKLTQTISETTHEAANQL